MGARSTGRHWDTPHQSSSWRGPDDWDSPQRSSSWRGPSDWDTPHDWETPQQRSSWRRWRGSNDEEDDDLFSSNDEGTIAPHNSAPRESSGGYGHIRSRNNNCTRSGFHSGPYSHHHGHNQYQHHHNNRHHQQRSRWDRSPSAPRHHRPDSNGHHNNHGRASRHYRTGDSTACGLSQRELLDLLFRDITPEDYDTLLRLDENNTKSNIASEDAVARLPTFSGKEHVGENCTVCMCTFDKDDEVTELPCRHRFHKACISKWLSECRQACPICGSQNL